MAIRNSSGLRVFAVAWGVMALAACSDNMGTNAGATSGTARLYMQRDTSSAPAGTDQADSVPGSPRAVKQDTVQYLKVTVTGIDYLAAGASDTSDSSGAWTHADLASSFDLDLMSLPADSAAAQLVATTSIKAGTYAAVRLRVTNPRIAFKGDVSFGVAGILTGGTEYAVVIPSAAQTGLKASVGVTVRADGTSDVGLVFDGARTVSNIAVTGTGQVMLNPVLRAR